MGGRTGLKPHLAGTRTFETADTTGQRFCARAASVQFLRSPHLLLCGRTMDCLRSRPVGMLARVLRRTRLPPTIITEVPTKTNEHGSGTGDIACPANWNCNGDDDGPLQSYGYGVPYTPLE